MIIQYFAKHFSEVHLRALSKELEELEWGINKVPSNDFLI